MTPLFDIEKVDYSYPGSAGGAISALHDINLKIEEGEFVAIIGANGSGKTTLARLLAALLIPSSGTIQIAGLNTSHKTNWSELHRLVGMVFQNPEDQIIANLVEEDVAFGLENLGLPPAEIRQRVQDVLIEVGLWDERNRPPHLLSAGQLQRLAFAGVIAMRPKSVIFDEVTTMLDPVGRQVIMDMMKSLNHRGITVIFITHSMEEAVQAKRVVILKDGKILLDGSPGQVFKNSDLITSAGLEVPLPGRIANRLRLSINDLPEGILSLDSLLSAILVIWRNRKGKTSNKPSDNLGESKNSYSVEEPLVDVFDLSHTYLQGTPLARLALDKVSLQINSNESRGLAGITGSGKSTFLQHLNGILRPQAGSVRVGSFNLNDLKVPMRSVIQLVGLVFQNPEMQFFEQYVGDEIAFGPRQLGLNVVNVVLTKETLAERVQWAMELVGLDFLQFKDRLIYTLSGGERRKVALASTLALKPSLLLMDEPTAGLDPHSRRDLLQRLKDLKTGGMTIVLSSHQMEVLAELADTLTVFSAGKTVLSGRVGDVFSDLDLIPEGTLERYGLEPPMVYQITQRLRAEDLPLPGGIRDANTLVEWLGRILV